MHFPSWFSQVRLSHYNDVPLRPNSFIEDKINLNYLLHLININISNVSSLSWHLSGLKTLPTVLNSRSTLK